MCSYEVVSVNYSERYIIYRVCLLLLVSKVLRGNRTKKRTNIRITCPCDLYPLVPHIYIVKLGFTGVYIIFLFLLQNIDCGYALRQL